MSPSPFAALILNPPSELVIPIASLKVTSPAPEVIVRVLDPLSVSIAPPKSTSPMFAPVPVVIVTFAERSTPDVANSISSADVVKVAAPVMSIFPPPVFAV